MDKRLGIGVLVVVILGAAGAWWLLSSGTSEPDRWTYQGLEDLERIEMERDGGAERLVMERSAQEGGWRWVEPVEGGVDLGVSERLEQILTADMESDTWSAPAEEAARYGLGDDEAVKMTLQGAGGDARELMVGEEREVVEAGGMRTFIQVEGPARIVRVAESLGEVLRRPLEELRDRRVLMIGGEGVEGVSIRHIDGHEIHIQRRGDRWRLAEGPAAVRGLEDQRGQRLAATVGRLEAERVVDGEPEDMGFFAPEVEVEVHTSEGAHRLEIVQSDEGEYLVRRKGSEVVYALSDDIGAIVTSRLADVRDRRLVGVPSEELMEIRLAGENPVHLRRTEEGQWTAVGEDDQNIDGELVESLVGYVARLRVEKWVDGQDEGELGFGDPDQEVIVGVDAEQYRLQIGDSVEGTRGQRYGVYEGAYGVFTMSRGTVERLTWSMDDIRLSER